MNASAPALTREDEVRSKIGKVRAFGRTARLVCAVFLGFGLVGCVAMLFFGVIGMFFPLPAPEGGASLTPEQKMWALPVSGIVMSAWLLMVYQLYRLFGNLATGTIYTPENVRRVRHVGLLSLLLAVLGVLIPVVLAALIRLGVDVPKSGLQFSMSEIMGSFISAGLILLASWILDVGLYEKDHAEALQRDADLVI